MADIMPDPTPDGGGGIIQNLGHKVGPLPLWVWIIISAVVLYFIYTKLMGGTGLSSITGGLFGGSTTSSSTAPPGSVTNNYYNGTPTGGGGSPAGGSGSGGGSGGTSSGGGSGGGGVTGGPVVGGPGGTEFPGGGGGPVVPKGPNPHPVSIPVFHNPHPLPARHEPQPVHTHKPTKKHGTVKVHKPVETHKRHGEHPVSIDHKPITSHMTDIHGHTYHLHSNGHVASPNGAPHYGDMRNHHPKESHGKKFIHISPHPKGGYILHANTGEQYHFTPK